MPRKSPRARRKAGPVSRLPKNPRTRSTPGRDSKNGRAPLRSPRAGHRSQGARAVPVQRPPATPRKPARRPTRSGAPDPDRVRAVLGQLERLYPEASTALRFEDPLQLLIATILSAQCTDERVNQVTPELFRRYPDAAAFAAGRTEDIEALVRPTGFFRNKTRAIQSCCRDIVARHGGRVPPTLDELTALHGVGRKTANVVLGNAFGIPGLVVDTHVARVSRRLGLTAETDPVKIEFALMPVVPGGLWTRFSHWLILHGRRVCVARKPRCSVCALAPHCPQVGVVISQ